MCSNMCARPVMPGTSWADPTFTTVANEKTGASGRSMTMAVRPWSGLGTVVRFSYEARSCAAAAAAIVRSAIAERAVRLKIASCSDAGVYVGAGADHSHEREQEFRISRFE